MVKRKRRKPPIIKPDEEDMTYGAGYRLKHITFLYKHLTMSEVTELLTSKARDGTPQIPPDFKSPAWKKFLASRRRFQRKCKKRGISWSRVINKYYADNPENTVYDFLREQYLRVMKHVPKLSPAMRERARVSRAKTKKAYGHHRGDY